MKSAHRMVLCCSYLECIMFGDSHWFDDGDEFELLEDHITLLQNAYLEWDEGCTGAPAIDCKRPYGN